MLMVVGDNIIIVSASHVLQQVMCTVCKQLDPAYQRMPSDADDVGSGCLLLSHLRCSDDTAQLMLDYSTIATPADDVVATSNTSTAVNIQLLQGGFALPFSIFYSIFSVNV